MKKKLISFLTATVIAASLLAGCGGSGSAPAASGDQAEAEAPAEGGELTTITVAASPIPHAEILEQAKPLLAEKGYDLDIKVFEDYVQPNEVVNSGEIDANYFQHVPYLDSFNGLRWMRSATATSSQFPMIRPTRQERFCCCRRTASSRSRKAPASQQPSRTSQRILTM